MIPSPLTGIVVDDGGLNIIISDSIFNEKSKLWDNLIEKISKEIDEQKSDIATDKIKSGLEKMLDCVDQILDLKGLHQVGRNISNFFGITSNQGRRWEDLIEEYLLQNVRIITFNYDNSFERIFWENSDITNSTKKFISDNLKHVYGEISLKIKSRKNEELEKGSFGKNSLWKALFSCSEEESEEVMNISLPTREGSKFYKAFDVFGQLDKGIKWIGSQGSEEIKKDRASYVAWLKEANEIYILGFGFDKNNLYRIGLTDEMGKLDKEIFVDEKKIFVSGVNAKIITQIRNLLTSAGFNLQYSTINENVSEINFGNNKIVLSKSFLPDVLSSDF